MFGISGTHLLWAVVSCLHGPSNACTLNSLSERLAHKVLPIVVLSLNKILHTGNSFPTKLIIQLVTPLPNSGSFFVCTMCSFQLISEGKCIECSIVKCQRLNVWVCLGNQNTCLLQGDSGDFQGIPIPRTGVRKRKTFCWGNIGVVPALWLCMFLELGLTDGVGCVAGG